MGIFREFRELQRDFRRVFGRGDFSMFLGRFRMVSGVWDNYRVQGRFLDVSRDLSESFRDFLINFRRDSECFMMVSGRLQVCFRRILRRFQADYRGVTWELSESNKRVRWESQIIKRFNENSGRSQKFLRGYKNISKVCGGFQEGFRKLFRRFQCLQYFSEDFHPYLGGFQEDFRGVSKRFQASFRVVFKDFSRSFKRFYLWFQKDHKGVFGGRREF